MATYRVCLHGTASVWVTVEAESSREASRKAVEEAPHVKCVKSWSPVMTCQMGQEEKQ